MERPLGGRRPARVVQVLGGGLFLVAVVHHALELRAAEAGAYPLAALAIDGTLALGLGYGGRRLERSDLDDEGLRQACRWTIVGAVLFGLVMGSTLALRLLEGRAVGEPLFPLLVATEAGAVGGLLAGHRSARASARKREARAATEAFEFVNDVVRHDLRNDLTVVQGYAADLDTEPANAVGDATAEALTRIRTTDDLAAAIRGDEVDGWVDLAAITAEVAERADERFPVPVRTDLPSTARVTGNLGLRSVVDNLLENAVEHNDPEDLEVDVTLTRADDVARLTVSDNGAGIDEEGSPFGRSAGADGARGLRIVDRLVDAYGGEVRVEDSSADGTAFVVELPRAT